MFDGSEFGRSIVAAVKAAQEPLLQRIASVEFKLEEAKFKLEEANAFIRTFQHVPGPPGPPGPAGEPGKDGSPGEPGRDGRDGQPGRDGKDGVDGKEGPSGRNGKDGIDGVGYENMTSEVSEDGREIIDRYIKDNVIRYEFRRHRATCRGTWRHDETYLVDDTAISNNCLWVARVNNPKGKPGDNEKSWQLVARKGRDGKDGERGPPGPQGPPGKDASY
jgi:integrin beta 3